MTTGDAQHPEAWAERVRASREQAERMRETQVNDFYGPVAGQITRRDGGWTLMQPTAGSVGILTWTVPAR